MRAVTTQLRLREPAPRRAAARKAAARRAGLGLVEAMVALAITAALLTAVAAAFSASSAAINENDEFFMATQGGRVALSRILTQVRRGTVATTSTPTELTLITDTGMTHKYLIDLSVPDQGVIKLITVKGGIETPHVLARTISAGSFSYEKVDEDGDGQDDYVKRVAMTLTVKRKNNQIVFSGTGTSRALLKY